MNTTQQDIQQAQNSIITQLRNMPIDDICNILQQIQQQGIPVQIQAQAQPKPDEDKDPDTRAKEAALMQVQTTPTKLHTTTPFTPTPDQGDYTALSADDIAD